MTVVWLDLVDAALGVERLVEVSVQHPPSRLTVCAAVPVTASTLTECIAARKLCKLRAAFQVKIANPCSSCGGASKQAAVSSMCQLCYGSGEVMRKHTVMHGRSSFWSCHVRQRTEHHQPPCHIWVQAS